MKPEVFIILMTLVIALGFPFMASFFDDGPDKDLDSDY